MDDDNELLETVDEAGRITGTAPRAVLHNDPTLLHQVVHVLVVNAEGDLLLQKRSSNKDIAPGRWDTSVGGHVMPGEGIHDAAVREMREELCVSPPRLTFLYRYLFRNHREAEIVHTFTCQHEGPFSFNTDEIDEVRFWTLDDIAKNIGTSIFSGHFETEFETYRSWLKR